MKLAQLIGTVVTFPLAIFNIKSGILIMDILTTLLLRFADFWSICRRTLPSHSALPDKSVTPEKRVYVFFFKLVYLMNRYVGILKQLRHVHSSALLFIFSLGCLLVNIRCNALCKCNVNKVSYGYTCKQS